MNDKWWYCFMWIYLLLFILLMLGMLGSVIVVDNEIWKIIFLEVFFYVSSKMVNGGNVIVLLRNIFVK